ncbi:hypothetical protein BpHYR1_011274 [Brachionus plicatilis]|uniref:Uncharacterized protein n=1 Tax=Brachionus plicatilis TaxID=10195 RepID=A0A3M7QTE1_BRAPC|nr:hypothetical protein BpHYR1_011274 [Brachionus plicatilis]
MRLRPNLKQLSPAIALDAVSLMSHQCTISLPYTQKSIAFFFFQIRLGFARTFPNLKKVRDLAIGAGVQTGSVGN